MSSFQFNFKTMNAFEIHKAIINTYVLKRRGDTELLKRNASKDKRDIDVLKDHHRFLWDNDVPTTWEEKFAKKYYDKLFKEYCICDLKYYKQNKVALRWRTEQEVIDGKGQFTCGHKICKEKEKLRTWEVNFAYSENNEKKNALVKIRLCPTCSEMLNYRTKKREIKRISIKTKKSNKTNKNPSKESEPSTSSSEIQIVEDNKLEDKEMKNKEESLWAQPQPQLDKTREEEFEEYLEELLF